MQLTPLRTRSTASALTVIAAMLVTACSYTTGTLDEPALRGKLIDADTSQPIQGAVIYGYYATAEGSLGGGETIKRVLRVFEVESDPEGIFEVPAWSTGWSITRGEPRQRFPAIAIYKDGYKLDLQNLESIRRWVPTTKLPGEATRSGNLVDWSAVPVQLKPVKSELERYNTLKNSNYAYADVGECGWEQHLKLIAAQHVALKSLIQRNVPTPDIDGRGYAKPTYFHPDPGMWGLSNLSFRDQLSTTAKKDSTAWQCKSPDLIFGRD